MGAHNALSTQFLLLSFLSTIILGHLRRTWIGDSSSALVIMISGSLSCRSFHLKAVISSSVLHSSSHDACQATEVVTLGAEAVNIYGSDVAKYAEHECAAHAPVPS